MAKYDAANNYLLRYLQAKDDWMSGNAMPSWFTSPAGVPSLQALLDVFDTSEEDSEAYRVYNDIKDPDKKTSLDAETKYRLRHLFMAALTSAVRKQYMAGSRGGYRTMQDTFRYEMANTRAVRCCLTKFIGTLKDMDEGKTTI
jgi:hypothetical protein